MKPNIVQAERERRATNLRSFLSNGGYEAWRYRTACQYLAQADTLDDIQFDGSTVLTAQQTIADCIEISRKAGDSPVRFGRHDPS